MSCSKSVESFTTGVQQSTFIERFAGRSTRLHINGVPTNTDTFQLIPLSDYTQLDATLGYTYKNISLRTKIGNVTNVLSYNVHDDNSVNPIAPRNFNATLAVKF